jgi:hypothetical protein
MKIKTGMLTLATCTLALEGLASEIRQEKETKFIQIGKKTYNYPCLHMT